MALCTCWKIRNGRCNIRIISEFHDYYDGVQAQGQDQSCVWIRKKKKEYFPDRPGGQWTDNSTWPFPVCEANNYRDKYYHRGRYKSCIYNCSQYIVGFCGKIYPLLELSVDDSGERSTYCYTLAEVDVFMETHLSEKSLKGFRNAKKYYWKDSWGRNSRRGTFEKFFDECRHKQGDFEEDFFIPERCPVFVATYNYGKREDSWIIYHASLKGREFYRIFDTYMAFQEIFGYMSGVLGGVREHVPEIEDKTLSEAKGFDKWSFRKEPTKRK